MIFDLDGVIIDSFVVIPEIYKIIKKELNLAVPEQVFESGNFFKVDWKKHLKRLGITSPQEIKKVVEIYYREYARLEHLINPFPDIKNVLEELSTHFKLAIVSNSHLEKIESMLKKFRLLNYFDCVIGADQGTLKPDPTQFFLCLDCLKVKPESAVYIGDMEDDVLAARNAQLKKVIVVTYGFHSEDRLMRAKPDLIISKPEEIVDAIM
ncbi:MAG: HAD family hydrolase [Candidatus Heimdallarchaeota archaeon]